MYNKVHFFLFLHSTNYMITVLLAGFVNFPFLDGDVPCSPSYGVYISQLIRFARVCSNDDDFNNRNLFLTAKLHTGQCKRTGGCYNELVVAFFSTGGGVKGKKIYTC